MLSVFPTYHVDCNLQFPSPIVQNASVINDNVQSLESCVCFLECPCNIHIKDSVKEFFLLAYFPYVILMISIGCRG